MAELAINPQSGEAVYLNDSGSWVPAPTAKNPQTGQELVFNGRDWQAKPGAQRSAGEMAGGYVEQAISGVPIVGPLAQKFSAAAQAAMGQGQGESFGERYSSNVATADARRASFKQDNPAGSALAQGVGGAGAMVATLPAAATQTGAHVLGLAGRNLAQRAASGGASGALIGGADAAARGNDPVSGAAVGGMVGALVPPVAQAVGAAARGVRNAFSPQANVAADLSRAIARDKMTPDQLTARATQLAAERPGVATLADAGGENVKGLVERVAQTPGAGRTQVVPSLTVRQQGQMTRIADDLSNLTGQSRGAFQAIEQTMAARKAAADPLYQQAMNFNARNDLGIMRAWAQETNQGWGKAALNSPEFARNLQTEYGIKNAQDAPMMQVIQSWKVVVDDMMGAAKRAGNNNQERILRDMKERVIAAVDAANPAYAQARAAWAGPTQFMEAIENGRNILSPKMSAAEWSANFQAATASEKEGMIIGAISAIKGKMGSDPAKLGDMTKYVRSPEMRAKIEAIMPSPQAADAFMRKLDFEVASSELTGRALGNSATARRLAERRDADGIMGDLVMDALGGSPVGSIWHKAIGAVPTAIRDTLRSKADARLADVLTAPANATGNALAAIMAPVSRASQSNNNALTMMLRGAAGQ